MAFPSSIPSYAGFTSTHTLSADNHASQHNSEQADIVAIATKIGTGASTPVSGTVLRGNGAGTSTWSQLNATTDVTGVLPTTNGGTGTSSSTGMGALVLQNSPSLTTPSFTNATGSLSQPTITDFTNANHNHQNATGGGTLTGSAFQVGSQIADKEKNPYKFRVYLNTPTNTVATTFTRVPYDTASFDTGGNVDLTTNKGRFTAPIAGFYFFTGAVNFNGAITRGIVSLYKNGSETTRGPDIGVSANPYGTNVLDIYQLTAGDFVEIYYYCSTAGITITNSPPITTFSGYLVSAT